MYGEESDNVFFGTYEHSVDSKGRVFLPIKLTCKLGENFVVTRTLYDCVSVYRLEDWEKYVEKLEALPNYKYANLKRLIYSRTQVASLDSQGRLLIPIKFRDDMNLKGDIVVVGNNNSIELWAKDTWTSLEKQYEEEMANIEFGEEVDL
ncbi:MAG: division/cell wall cluster transcriptional repressor MraZ [Ruminococcaceae bacterium]|nr:division/cell wall cluster transcriptional repressor MraZ [Oscillospiraceae bacterium]